jgi:hypothetical protein
MTIEKKQPHLAGLWLLIAIIVFKVISHALVLFPISIQLGQGAVPWLMAQGRVLYVDILEHRPPLTAWIVTLVQPLLGGDTLLTVRILHVATIILILILIFTLTLRLSRSNIAAMIAIIIFALLESIYINVAFYFEVVQGLLYVSAALFLTSKVTFKRTFIAGLLLGITFLVKQQAVLAAGFVVLIMLTDRAHWRYLWSLSAGLVIPVLLVCGVYYFSGLWSEFIYWNITFNAVHAGGLGGPLTGDFFRRVLLTHAWVVPFVALLFADAAPLKRRDGMIIVLLFVAALAAHYPRVGEIHSAGALPLLSLMAGMVIAYIFQQPFKAEKAVNFAFATVFLAATLFNVLTSYIPTPAGFRSVLGADELRPVSDWLRTNASTSDSLYILPASDSTAQIQVLAGLIPPQTWTPGNEYFYNVPEIVGQLIADWETNPPTWIVFFPQLAAETLPDGATPLLDFLERHYSETHEIPNLPFYGDAMIMRYVSR